MSTHFHAMAWIDHQVAKVFHFDALTSETAFVRSNHPHRHLHHKANSADSGHAPVDNEFLGRVVAEISRAGAILITGPGTAKLELRSFIQQRYPHLSARIAAVEALDHPSDGELLAFGRKFFAADERMHPQVAAGA